MLSVKNHSPYRKYYRRTAIILAILLIGAAAFSIIKHIQAGGMGETTYKRNPTPDYSPTPSPQKSKTQRKKDDSPPSHTAPVDASTRQRPSSGASKPKRSTTPAPRASTPASPPATTPVTTPTPSPTTTPEPEDPVEEPAP